MRDEIYDREYQLGRDALHDGIDRLIDGLGQSLLTLNKIQFDAPWKKAPARQRRAKAA